MSLDFRMWVNKQVLDVKKKIRIDIAIRGAQAINEARNSGYTAKHIIDSMINRHLHFSARSNGQKARWAKQRFFQQEEISCRK